MALPVSDTFLQSTGSSQNLTTYNSAWTITQGAEWVVPSGTGAVGPNDAAYQTAAYDGGESWGDDQVVTIEVGSSANYVGPAVRCGASDGYHSECQVGTTTIYFSKRVSGADSNPATRTLSSALAAGDMLRLEVVGTTFKIYHAPAASPTTFTQVGADITDSDVASGLPGIFAYSFNQADAIRSFTADNVGGSGGPYTTSGTASISGTLTASGSPALGVAYSGAAALTGTLTPSGTLLIGEEFEVDAPLEAAFSGTLTPAGDVSIATGPYETSGTAALSGALTPAGEIGLAVAHSGDAALSGSLSITGDVSATIAFNLSGDVPLSGVMTPAGDVEAINGNFTASGDAALAGSLTITGDVLSSIAFDVDGNAALTGSLTPSGEIFADTPFQLPGNASLAAAFVAAGEITSSDAPISGHGFEMAEAKPRRRNMVYILPDEPKASPADTREKPKTKTRTAEAVAEAKRVIEEAAKAHAQTTLPKPQRFGQVRAVLKPIAKELGDWNWVAQYQRMYDEALKEQLRRELEIADQIDEDEAIAFLLENL